MRIFVFFNSLVMDLVSLPEYVKVAHFCFCAGVGVLFVVCGWLGMNIMQSDAIKMAHFSHPTRP
jgi:hypothetical protein